MRARRLTCLLRPAPVIQKIVSNSSLKRAQSPPPRYSPRTSVYTTFKVLRAAHGNIDAAYRALPLAYSLENRVLFPSYELCSNETELEEYQGRMVVAVAFASGRDFQPDAIAELKELCIVRFTEEAARNGITCSYAGIEGWRNLSFSERTDIESG